MKTSVAFKEKNQDIFEWIQRKYFFLLFENIKINTIFFRKKATFAIEMSLRNLNFCIINILFNILFCIFIIHS